MINQYLAQVLDDDKHREVEKAQLIQKAGRLRKEQLQQPLAKIACRFGLTKIC